jgi:hypothetical protein
MDITMEILFENIPEWLNIESVMNQYIYHSEQNQQNPAQNPAHAINAG